MKKNISIFLLSGILISLSINNNLIFASNLSNKTNSIVARADKYDVSKTITQSNKNGEFKATYKYAKVHFQSSNSAKQTVHIQDSKGNTLTNGSFSINGNSSNYIFLELKAGTTYKYNVTTENGATEASGILNIRTATTENELN